jgi:DNA-binding GntR family transcriptional regulator
MIDGVCEIGRNGGAVFHPVPAPTDEDVAAVIERIYRTVVRKLGTRGDDESAPRARELLERVPNARVEKPIDFQTSAFCCATCADKALFAHG